MWGICWSDKRGAYTHTIVLDPDIYGFNFFLTDADGMGVLFDFSKWDVTGTCYESGSLIRH